MAEELQSMLLKTLLLRSLIKHCKPEEFDLVCELYIRLLPLERELSEILSTEPCASPEWHEIGADSKPETQNTSLERTRDFLRVCFEKTKGKDRVKKKKASKSILEVLEGYNIKIKGKMILCPFHDDRTPSCRIYPETDSFYCFGCGKYGTADELEKQLRSKL